MPATHSPDQITVLLVDDHAIVREGLRRILETASDLKIVGEAVDGRDAVKQVQELRPQVVVLDVAMPFLNGAEAARQIGRHMPETKIVVLTTYSESEVVRELISAGVSGYVTKDTAGKELLTAIREVARGNSFFSPSIATHVLNATRESFAAPVDGAARTPALTSREVEVLQLVAEGHANKQVADKLSISIKTVEKHRQSLMNKLKIHETATLTRYAASKRIIQCDVFPKAAATPVAENAAT